MIENFTPEELRIIARELAELGARSEKKLIFKKTKETIENTFHPSIADDICKHVLALADYVTNNYVVNFSFEQDLRIAEEAEALQTKQWYANRMIGTSPVRRNGTVDVSADAYSDVLEGIATLMIKKYQKNDTLCAVLDDLMKRREEVLSCIQEH